MKRIRYIKQGDGSLVSMQTLKGGSRELKSVLHPGEKSGELVDAVTGDIVASVTGTSPHKTRIALKKALEAQGVMFIAEGRLGRAKTDNVSNS